MEVLHSRCAGLDVHKDVVLACGRPPAGIIGRGQGRTGSGDTLGPAFRGPSCWPAGALAPVGAVAAYSPNPGALTPAYGSPPAERLVGRARQPELSLYWISLKAPGGKRIVRW